MVWENLSVAQRWGIYGFIFTALLVFTLLSRLNIRGMPLLALRTRILLALFFPVVIVLAFVFGALLFGLAALLLAGLFLYLLFGRKRVVLQRIKI